MRKLLQFFLVLLALTLTTSQAFSQGPKVLILYAEDPVWGNDVVSKVNATGLFSTVDGFDCRSTPPSLSFLQNYKAVLVFTDYGAAAGTADALGNYIDGGGAVVGAMFTQAAAVMSGEYWTSPYQVFTGGFTTGSASLGNVDLPNHPIMKGVSSFSGGSSSYRTAGTTLVGNAYSIARWTDGNILIGARENVGPKSVRRADLNFFPVSSTMRGDFWTASTDGAKIMANALMWVIGETPTQFAMSPEVMNFGSVYPGTPSILTGTLRNVGPATLKFSSVSINGMADFTVESAPAPNDSLPVGQSRNFSIRFNPATIGFRTATLTIVTNGQDSGTQTVDLRGIGAAPTLTISEAPLLRKGSTRLRDSATVCVPLTSSGTGSVRLDSVVIRGIDASAYSVVSWPKEILRGTTQDVCVRFKPNFEGRSDAQLVIYSDAYNKRVATIPMFGNGTLGRFVMTPTPLTFDSVTMGERVCKVVMIKNPGTDTMRIVRNYVASADRDFELTPISGKDTMIRPLDSVAFNVCFTPAKNGIRVARYLFYTDIPKTFEAVSRDTSMFILDIEGTGVPVGRLAMANPKFPNTVIGDEYCMTDTLINGGLSPVTVTSASITGLNSSDFTMTGLTLPAVLQPGERRLIIVCIKATERGAREAAINFGTTSEGKEGFAEFPLSGVGLLDCATADPLTPFAGTTTLVGRPDTATITVTNCGEVSRFYAFALLAGSTGYKIVGSSNSGFDVPPNGTATFQVEFNPAAMGASNGVAIVSGGPDDITINLSGVGGAVMLGASGNGGSVMQGDCRTFDVTVNNTGNVDWTPGTGTITGANASSFTIESAPSSIAAGGTGVVTIKFCPASTGSETAVLNFPAGSPQPLTNVFPYTLNGSGLTSNVTVTEMHGYKLGQSFPNPAQSATSISFTLPRAGNVKIELVDQTGRVIPVASGLYPMGESTLQLDASTLTSGTYLYVLSNDEVRLTRQMTVVK